MNVGQLLRQARKDAGLTQEDMSPLINISRSTISKVERNQMALVTEDFIRWLKIATHQIRLTNTAGMEAGMYLINGVDIFMLVESLTKVVGGFISFMNGGL
ncbi:helix-turn-helix domain-containing protein [Sporosarcina cyprini]|uniref:helix-turn-helix domain-containing protein n=1 Tax=Sporosarcina cyprini TaxID=2910523 RepID=UPI001EDF25EA|nr:helix-turn-helix domain-containing protein [Sporosarcina cyprini]